MKKKLEVQKRKKRKIKNKIDEEEDCEDLQTFLFCVGNLTASLRLAYAKIKSDIEKNTLNLYDESSSENITETGNIELPSTTQGTLNIDNSLSFPLIYETNNNDSSSNKPIINNTLDKMDEDENEDDFSFVIKNKFGENNITRQIRKENDLEYEYPYNLFFPLNGVFPKLNENNL